MSLLSSHPRFPNIYNFVTLFTDSILTFCVSKLFRLWSLNKSWAPKGINVLLGLYVKLIFLRSTILNMLYNCYKGGLIFNKRTSGEKLALCFFELVQRITGRWRYEDSDDLFFACEFRDKVSLLKDSDNKQSSEPFQRGVRRGSV